MSHRLSLPIELSAHSHPDELAFCDGKAEITYAALADELAKSTAARATGLRPGDHVAWCPGNDAESMANFWALQQRGCVACPVSHRYPAVAREEILKRIDARWLPDLEPGEPSSVPLSRSAADPATLILSSGSTGVPKAIVHTMAAHVASARGAATNMPLLPGDRWLWSLPLCHVSGLSIVVRCAVAGATVVGMQPQEKLTADLLHRRRVTHLSVVTTQLRRLLGEDNFPSPHLKSVLLGGSSVDETLVTRARKRGVAVHTTYGLSETATQVSTSTSTCDPSTSGRVLAGRELRISADGEILVRGDTLCLGYYRDGKVHRIVDDEGWFGTKDLGTISDQGLLTVHGRVDNMFISGGENIHPETIERAMMSIFEIQQVVVVPRPEASFGARPVAFVRGELPSDWEAQLRERLQGYEVPDDVLPWPAEADGAIKPNRKFLQQLAVR